MSLLKRAEQVLESSRSLKYLFFILTHKSPVRSLRANTKLVCISPLCESHRGCCFD
jgi:hypothetical protein